MNTIKALVFTIRTQLLPRLRMKVGIWQSLTDSAKIFNGQRRLPKKYQKVGAMNHQASNQERPHKETPINQNEDTRLDLLNRITNKFGWHKHKGVGQVEASVEDLIDFILAEKKESSIDSRVTTHSEWMALPASDKVNK